MDAKTRGSLPYLIGKFREDDARWQKLGRFLRKKTLHQVGAAGAAVVKPINPMVASKVYRSLTGYSNYLNKLIDEETTAIAAAAAGAKKPVFVDCGVNEAVVLEKFMSRLQQFRFVGFEIQEELIPVARERAPDATILNQAVSDSNDDIEIFLPRSFGPNYRGGSTTVATKIDDDKLLEKRVCKAVRLVDFLRKLRDEDGHDFVVVKMDIEGAEYPVIDDLERDASTRDGQSGLIDYFMVEFHPQVLPDPGKQQSYEDRIGGMGIPLRIWI